MARPRVLVTGATGYIASQLLPTFRKRYDLTLVDARAQDRNGQPVEGVTVVDLGATEPASYRHLFEDITAVVHLAYKHGNKDDLRQGYLDERDNVDLAFTIYHAALEAGVERVVVASSNHAADWYETLIRANKLEMLGPYDRALSDNWYGWAKEAYEHVGFVFACGSLGRKLPVVQIRIGAPREIDVASFQDNPVGYKRDLGAYISPRDLAQLFCRSIETPALENEHGIPFQIFYGISNNSRSFWSIANARRVIGYTPEDDSEVRYHDDIAAFLTGEPGKPGKVAG